jgi:ribosomal protein L11 methylase PrmA
LSWPGNFKETCFPLTWYDYFGFSSIFIENPAAGQYAQVFPGGFYLAFLSMNVVSGSDPMFHRLTPELVIRSPWRPFRPRHGEQSLVLEGSSVFPPSHPTTHLCLDLLKKSLASRPGAYVLDVGCGSGILGLAALALGAPRVLAVDISGRAVCRTRANAARNGLLPRLAAIQGSTECLRGPFDLILANLPWGVHLEKVEELCRLAGPIGVLIIAGFKDTQEEPLLSSYQSRGWSVLEHCSRDSWAPEPPPELSYTWVAWLLMRLP